VRRRLHTGRRFHVGRNFWLLARDPGARGLLKVRRGVIQEIGVVDAHLTRKRAVMRRFLRSFD
jgi:hypothetical protein